MCANPDYRYQGHIFPHRIGGTMSNHQTAVEVFASLSFEQELPYPVDNSHYCAHAGCGTFALHHWGMVRSLAYWPSHSRSSGRTNIVIARCSACSAETIFADGKLVYPATISAPAPAADLPDTLKIDFEEARLICNQSPRGAAALLRLVVQKLCPILGSEQKDINKAIGDLVERGVINVALQQALDSVRVIGNEAVHPGELDLKDDPATVLSLFKLINFIVQKAITEPKEIGAIYQALPASKLAGIEIRDKAKA
jgi:hypothetical protein